MSDATSRRPRVDSCELEPVTCWPLIYACGGFLLLGAVLGAALFVHDWLRPTRPVAQHTPRPKPVQEHQAAAIDRGPEPPAVAPAEPPRTPPVRRVVGNEYVPLPPVKPVVKEEFTSPVRLARKSEEERPVRLVRKEKAEVKVEEPTSRQPRQPLDRSAVFLAEVLQKQARELDLEATEGQGKQLLAVAKEHFEKAKEDDSFSSPLEKYLASREDLGGLPLLLGKACRTDKEQARVLGEVSRNYRLLQSRAERNRERERERSKEPSPPPSYSQFHPHQGEDMGYVDAGLKKYLTDCSKKIEAKKLLVGPLEQTYQIESAGLRVELIAALAKVDGKEATEALARRATFDLSPAVRKSAVEALKKRKAAEARGVLLAALRHPWAPAADHAALALVGLEDEGAISALEEIVDLPDPSLPVKVKDQWESKELVRVNHLRNCLLCHAPSLNVKDSVRAPIPTPGKALPTIYYDRQRDFNEPSVRADVVYFRQDFSAMHAVAKPNKWPEVQRFDYLVRSRRLDTKEAARRLEPAGRQGTYPQREAARWALATLQAPKLSRVD